MNTPDLETVEGVTALASGILKRFDPVPWAASSSSPMLIRAVEFYLDNPEGRPSELYDALADERTLAGEPSEPMFLLDSQHQDLYLLLAAIVQTALWGG